MRLLILSGKTERLIPFQGELKAYPNGGQYLEWGHCYPPVRIQVHYQYPPPWKPLTRRRVLLPQAYIQTKNRNLLIASEYLKEEDSHSLVCFCAHLPSGFKGKPAYVPEGSKRIFCDQKRPWQKVGFCIEGALQIFLGEVGIVNDTLPNGTNRHFRIFPRENDSPVLEVQPGHHHWE